MKLKMKAKLTPILAFLTTEKMWLAFYLGLVVFGWWIPNDLLDKSPHLRAFANCVASVIPQIDRVTNMGGSEVGQASRFLYSVLWVLVIVTTPFIAINRYRHLQEHGFEVEFRKIPVWKYFLLIIVGLLASLDALYLFWFDTSLRILHFAFANRFGIGLVAPLFAWGPGILLIGCLFLCWGQITGRILIGEKSE